MAAIVSEVDKSVALFLSLIPVSTNFKTNKQIKRMLPIISSTKIIQMFSLL